MSENAFILLSGWSNGVGCYITRGCLLSLLKFNCPPPVSPPWGHIPAINLLLPNDQPSSFYKLSVPLGPTFPLCIRSCCPLSIKQLFRLCPFSLLNRCIFSSSFPDLYHSTETHDGVTEPQAYAVLTQSWAVLIPTAKKQESQYQSLVKRKGIFYLKVIHIYSDLAEFCL